MPRRPLADKGIQTSVRLPRELYDRLMREAGEKGIGEEIRRRLEMSFTPTPVTSGDPRFGDLLTAIGHAAAAAAKMPAPREVPMVVGDGVRREDDKSPYVAFREAVTSLMDAFEPEGIRMVSDQTLIRLTDQLVGIALGALGDRGLAAFTNLAEVDQASMERSGGAASAMAVKVKKRSREEGNEP
jgi:hypothetical protein